MYVLRVLAAHPLRLFLTLSGIAMCILLVLFILGVYNGVATGSVEYVRQTSADIWVLQANSSNIMRGTSVLPDDWCDTIRSDARIASATPVLLFLTSLRIDEKDATVLLAGSVPGAPGGPPQLAEGRRVRSNDEIVLDKAFAAKHALTIGADVIIRGDTLTVVGISTGTNAFVTQYAFVTLAFEQSIVELPGLASFFIVRLRDVESRDAVMRDIAQRFSGRVSLHAHAEFLDNNIAEVEAGVLPLFFAIAAFAGVMLSIILSLILSVTILERRHDFAIMKLIGASAVFLRGIVVLQALVVGLGAELFALALLLPIFRFVEWLAPEVSTIVTAQHVALSTAAVLLISIASGLMAGVRVRHISTGEVFA